MFDPYPEQEQPQLFQKLLFTPEQPNIQPSPSFFSSDCKEPDIETDIWMLNQIEREMPNPLFKAVQELEVITSAREDQSRLIYDFLQGIHRGKFSRFVTKIAQLNSNKKDKKKIRKVAKNK